MPIEKIATFVKPLKIPVEGKDLFVWAQISSSPSTPLEAVKLIENSGKDNIIVAGSLDI